MGAIGLGERLRHLREKEGISLSEVARRAQVSKAYVSQLERGGSTEPSYSVVTRLATALGTTVEELTGQSVVWDPSEHEAIPGSLRTFAQRSGVPDVDVSMLAKIHFRGKRPRDPEDWAHLYETIKRTIR
jgi:transcriptional regulator with XRE-family HTH domain